MGQELKMSKKPLTEIEADMLRARGWVVIGVGEWYLQDKYRSLAHVPTSFLREGSKWWNEDLTEIRDELRERTPFQQGFWDAEQGKAHNNPFEEGTSEWYQYEYGLAEYWDAVSEMNEVGDDYYEDQAEEE